MAWFTSKKKEYSYIKKEMLSYLEVLKENQIKLSKFSDISKNYIVESKIQDSTRFLILVPAFIENIEKYEKFSVNKKDNINYPIFNELIEKYNLFKGFLDLELTELAKLKVNNKTDEQISKETLDQILVDIFKMTKSALTFHSEISDILVKLDK